MPQKYFNSHKSNPFFRSEIVRNIKNDKNTKNIILLIPTQQSASFLNGLDKLAFSHLCNIMNGSCAINNTRRQNTAKCKRNTTRHSQYEYFFSSLNICKY